MLVFLPLTSFAGGLFSLADIKPLLDQEPTLAAFIAGHLDVAETGEAGRISGPASEGLAGYRTAPYAIEVKPKGSPGAFTLLLVINAETKFLDANGRSVDVKDGIAIKERLTNVCLQSLSSATAPSSAADSDSTESPPAGERVDYATPAEGSSLRKQLLDVIRKPTEEHLGQAVVFKVKTLRASDPWAFFQGRAIRADGNPIDYKKSREFRKDPKSTKIDLDAGNLYGGVDALLKKDGMKWQIVTIMYDPTDVHWSDWDKRFGAPKSLLPNPTN